MPATAGAIVTGLVALKQHRLVAHVLPGGQKSEMTVSPFLPEAPGEQLCPYILQNHLPSLAPDPAPHLGSACGTFPSPSPSDSALVAPLLRTLEGALTPPPREPRVTSPP